MITYFDALYEPWMTTDLEIFDGWAWLIASDARKY